MRILHILLLLFAVSLGGVVTAAPLPPTASRWLDLGEARLRLILEPARAGDTQMRAGLEIRLNDNFKTYWRNPGDSGVPPVADFSRSTGLKETRIDFPFPIRFDDGAGGTAFGYKQAVVLPIAGIRDGNAPLKLHLALDFAVCGTMCIPLSGELELVEGSPAAIALPPEEAGILEAARQLVPRTLDEASIRAQIAVYRMAGGNKPRWRIVMAPGLQAGPATIFFEAKGYLSSSLGMALPDGGLSFEVAGEPAPGANGLFGPTRVTIGGAKPAFEAMIDLDGAPQGP